MAASAEQTLILQMTLSLFNATPGAVFLAEFEALRKASNNDIFLTAEKLAAHTVFKGLYPDSMSNLEFGKAFIERLVGSEAKDEDKAWAANWVSGQLDLGSSRANVMLKTAQALLNVKTDHEAWGKAHQAFNNKVKTSEYLSIETKQSSTNLSVLQNSLASTTSDASTVPTTPVKLLVANYQQAQDALSEYLKTADNDNDAKTSATSESLNAALTKALENLDKVVDGNYAGASEAVRKALLSDQEKVNTELDTLYKKGVEDALKATEAITGLKAAIEAREKAVEEHDAAKKAVVDTHLGLLTELSAYTKANNVAIDVNDNGTIAGLIVLNGANLVLNAGVTEATHPGIDKLLAASIAKEEADKQKTTTQSAESTAIEAVDNLDLSSEAKGALAVLGTKFSQTTPANASTPTGTEITAEATALNNAKNAANQVVTNYTAAAALATTADANTTNSGAVTDDLAAIKAAFNGATGITTEDQALVTATTSDEAALSTIQTIVNQKNVALINANTALNSFNDAKTSYDNAANTNPLYDALLKAQQKAKDAAANITQLDKLKAEMQTAQANVDKLKTLEDAVKNAKASFTNIGLSVPESIDGSATATDDRDIWLAAGKDGTISGMADKDTLYIGTELTLNNAKTAGANSADSLLEVWLTDKSGSTAVTMESSMTGGSADPQETYEITLTGVSIDSVKLVDGFISLV